jgi:asparagine synthase (glutamine-hydrolysing)
MAGELARMVWQLDEPEADFSALNVLFISRLARQHGIKVLLSGAGGDDLFTGYRRHRALGLNTVWDRMPRRLPGRQPLL